MNPYDDLLAANQQTNRYDEILAQDVEEKKQRAQGSLAVASQQDPNRQGEVIDIATRKRIPTAVVDANLDQFKREAVDYDQLIRETPKLAEWVSEPENASIAHDDLPSMSNWEWMLKGPALAWKQSHAIIELGQLGTRWTNAALGTGPALTEAEERRIEELQALHAQPTGADSLFAKLYLGPAETLPQIGYAIQAGVAPALKYSVTAGVSAALAGPGAPVTVPAAAIAGGAAGLAEGGYRASYEMEAGNAALEFRAIRTLPSAEHPEGEPIDPRIAAMAAQATGALNGVIELGGLAVLARSFPVVKTALGKFSRKAVKDVLERPSARQALADLAKQYGGVWTAEVAQEVFQETVTIIAGELAKGSAPGEFERTTVAEAGERIGQTAAQAATSFALVSLIGPGTQAAIDLRRVKQANDQQKFFESLGTAESKVRDRTPSKFREFVAKATKDGPLETVYIPADRFVAYFQGANIDPAEVLAKMPEVAAQLDEALAAGGDLAVPMADFATYLAPSEHYKGLSKDLRMRPQDMTAREAEAWQEGAEELGKELEKAAALDAEKLPPGDRRVFANVVEQLEGAGLERATAERNATLMASVFKSLGERAGIDPMELYEQYGLKIQRGTAPQADQAAEVERIIADDNLLTPIIEDLRKEAAGSVGTASAPVLAEVGGEEAARTAPAQIAAEPSQVVKSTDAAGAQQAKSAPTAIQAGPARGIAGGQGRVRIGDKYEPVQWAVMDAASLAPTFEKAENQYRDRNRAAAQAQVQAIAAGLDFNLLGDSPLMDYGAPTMAPDGRIVGGNGRLAGIRMAYEGGGAGAYRDALAARAGEFGLAREDVESMERPVLVRILDADVDVKAAAIASNEGGALQMSALETAKVDAERVGSLTDFEFDDAGQLSIGRSLAGIRRWVGALPAQQRGAITDAQGNLSGEGARRLQNAILYRAYGDSQTLARLVDSVDPGSRNIAAALMRAAPGVANLREGIAAGQRYPLDPSQDIQDAVERLVRIRESGQSVDEALRQQDLLGKQLSDEAEVILRFLGANLRSSRTMGDFVNRYLAAAERAGSPQQGDIFGDREIPTKLALLDEAAATATPAMDLQPTQTGQLFQAPAPKTWQQYLEEWTPEPTLTAEQKAVEARFMAWILDDPERAVAAYNRLEDAEGGKVISADVARELSPDYLADRTLSVAVQEPASAMTKALYAKRLPEPLGPGEDAVVLFSAGGMGAGKSSGIKRFLSKQKAQAHIVFDSNMGNFRSGMQKIGQAFAADHRALIVYTDRELENAFRVGFLGRAHRQEEKHGTGRTAPLDVFLETHYSANHANREFVAALGDESKVEFLYIINEIDRSQSRLGTLGDIHIFDDFAYNSVRERLIEIVAEEAAAGRISESIGSAVLDTEIPRSRSQVGTGDRGESPAQRDGGTQGRNAHAIIGAAIARAGLDIQTASDEDIRAALRASDAQLFQQSQPRTISRNALADKGFDKTTTFEPHVDAPGFSPEQLANIFERATLSEKGDRVLILPSMTEMVASVRAAALVNPQILDAVVAAVPVDVVNDLFGSETAAKVALHNEAVFKDRAAFNADLAIAKAIDATSPVGLLMREAALAAAKMTVVPLDAGVETAEGSAAMVADRGFRSPIGSFTQDRLGGGPRAVFDPSTKIITLFETSDLSSFLHESAHFYLEVINEIATRPNAPQQLIDDMGTLLKWFGFEGDLAAWNAQSIDARRDHHEKFARGWEAYLFEGKAPNVELQSLFSRFRAWLVSIYRSVEALNVKINDEIRQVFDRLVATDAEIKAANEAQNYVELFTSAEAAGQTAEEFSEYRRAVQRALVEAEEQLTQEVLGDLTREQKAWWADEREKIAAEVMAEINANPVYRALAFLQRGQQPDGTAVEGVEPLKLSRAALIDQYGKAFLKKLPRPYIYSVEGGVAPDVVATMFGFDSGDAMIQGIVGARAISEALETTTDERMKAKHGDALLDGSLAEKAMEAVHNDRRADLLAAELKALKRLGRRAPRAGQAQQVTQEQDERRVITEAARQLIAGRKVRDIRPDLHRVATAKASRAAFNAATKGDYDLAYQEKRRQLLNHELYRAAVAARHEVERIREFMRRFESSKKRGELGKAGSDYLEQIDDLMTRFDFRRMSLKAGEKRLALAAWVQERREKGMEINLPGWMLDESNRKPFRELTFEQLQGVHDAVVNIDHLARLKNRLLANEIETNIDDVVAEIEHSILTNHKRSDVDFEFAPTLGDKIQKGTKLFFAQHTKLEFLFNWLDGNKDGLGPVWRALFKPLADAEGLEQRMQRESRAAIRDIFARYSKQERWAMFHRRIWAPEIGKSVNKATLLAAALNVGNKYNREMLMKGYKWTEHQLRALLARLEDRDWETVQMIWDHLESFWPAIRDLQKDLTGLPPLKVQAVPFQSPTRRNMRGGYYPIKYDSQLSWRQEEQDEATKISEMYGGNYTRIMTLHGHVKERTNSGGKAIKLDLSVMGNHIVNVIHDVTHRRAILDVDRLVTDERVQDAIERTAGREMYGQLRPWLKNIASDMKPNLTVMEGMLNHLRAGGTVVAMGVKMTTALVQPLGYSQTIELLGPKYSAIGLRETYARGNPVTSLTSAREFAFERSEQLRNRMHTFDRDIRDAIKGMTAMGKEKALIRRGWFFLIGLLDMSVAIPTWIGAYRKAMDGAADGIEAGNEKDAIDFADSMLRRSQSAGGAKDLAMIQAGHPLLKNFTVFYSFFNVLFNIFKRRAQLTNFKRPADYPRFVASMVVLWFAPGILSEILAGRGPDDDEPWDEYLSRTAWAWGPYPLQSIAFVRDIVNAAGPYGYSGPPVVDAIATTGRAAALPAKLAQEDEELTKADVRAVVMAVSYWGHLPGRQMWITGSYIYDWATGEEDPESIAEVLEGMAFARKQ